MQNTTMPFQWQQITQEGTCTRSVVAKGLEPNNYSNDSVDESITRITASTP